MTIARKEAYQEYLPKSGQKRWRIFEVIRAETISGGLTISELAGGLGWPMNCVSSRVSELADQGFIKEDGIRHGQTIWIEAGESERAELSNHRVYMKGKSGEIAATTYLPMENMTLLTIKIPGHQARYKAGMKVRL